MSRCRIYFLKGKRRGEEEKVKGVTKEVEKRNACN